LTAQKRVVRFREVHLVDRGLILEELSDGNRALGGAAHAQRQRGQAAQAQPSSHGVHARAGDYAYVTNRRSPFGV